MQKNCARSLDDRVKLQEFVKNSYASKHISYIKK